VQPIFGAIDAIAAHRDEYSCRCSDTIRTARSLTSVEYLVVVVPIAPSSQMMEPPGIPERFILRCSTCNYGYWFSFGGGGRSDKGVSGRVSA